MGGMFTTLKVRAGLAAGDYRDPGWYRQPAGTSAYLWEGETPDATRAKTPEVDDSSTPLAVRKPQSHQHQ
jgi:hypothetical protein